MNRLIKQMRDIIGDVLSRAGGRLNSRDAVELLLMTGAVESGYSALKQYHSGPACSYFQVEKRTCVDIYKNYLIYRKKKMKAVALACCLPDKYAKEIPSEAECAFLLTTNIAFAICMARYVYYRVPKRLPKSGHTMEQAEYWLKYYNAGGKGSIEKFVEAQHLLS